MEDLILPLKLTQILHLLALHKLIDAFQMLRHFLVSELIDLRDQPIQEITVVGYDDQRPVKVKQRLLQDILRLHIQMVCRLVEDQDVKIGRKDFCQGNLAALAAREGVAFCVVFGGTELGKGALAPPFLLNGLL